MYPYIIKCAVISLANEHKCYDVSERERIEKAGGAIKQGKVNGKLEITRALGYPL